MTTSGSGSGVSFEYDAYQHDLCGVPWIHGSPSSKHNTDPDIQLHWVNPHTMIMRQNMAVDYEAPFLYLLFGTHTALLFDTGATSAIEWFPLRPTVDRLLEVWRSQYPGDHYQLLIMHSHGHDDHVAADGQFAGRPDTQLVEATAADVHQWLAEHGDGIHARVDLGGRVVECLATPGHHPTGLTLYDPATRCMLTGDTVYPGRLYVEDWAAYAESIDRMLGLASTHPVVWLLGSHIEMTNRPGEDYPVRTTFQPDETDLPMGVADLHSVRKAISEIGERAGWHSYPNFRLQRPE